MLCRHKSTDNVFHESVSDKGVVWKCTDKEKTLILQFQCVPVLHRQAGCCSRHLNQTKNSSSFYNFQLNSHENDKTHQAYLLPNWVVDSIGNPLIVFQEITALKKSRNYYFFAYLISEICRLKRVWSSWTGHMKF